MYFYKNRVAAIGMVLLAVILVVGAVGCSAAYEGPPSDHFDGSHFFNKEPDHTFTDELKWLWEMETVEWPEWIDDPPQSKPVESVKDGKLRITFVNHATVLIQMDGLNILTDPIWSERAGPLSWLGTKRIRAPGVKMEDLPKIDVVLISHDHYDHLDLPTLKRLDERFRPVILVGLGVKRLLASESLSNIYELDWWRSRTLHSTNVKITLVPARHNSGRAPFQHNKTLWGGFVVEGSAGKVYFAGDTAYDSFLELIKKRFNGFRLTVFPVGSYEKRWFMKDQHMNPDDAVKAHVSLNSKQSVGMHFGTFVEHPEQTVDAHEKDLSDALKKYRVPKTQFRILKFGEGKDVP
ncbi:MAG: hypothetical protein GY866_30310 [Proteobacteria bacterium]|nr:hypothetical protein [Pseudomonadota bacterium]